MNKISLCTTCKNRLNHIKETLPYNLEMNNRQDTEFVLLDYWSTDGLEEWVRTNLMDYIELGKLNYYKLKEPTDIFILTHAINIAFKLAQGDIVCNVDADNFTGQDFDEHLIELMKPKSIAESKSGYGLCGRKVFWKEEFIESLGGYDEDMRYGWGFDECDIKIRAEKLGFSVLTILNKYEGSYIHHEDIERSYFNIIKQQNQPYSGIWTPHSLHKKIHDVKMEYGIFKANPYRKWGEADVSKNFKD